MRVRNAVIGASVAALIASSGVAWAAYTGQLNIIQWAGTVLGVPTAYGTAPTTGNYIGVNAAVTNNTTPGDATSTAAYGAAVPTIGTPLLWNGTTYDRWKEGSATGVGLMSLTGTLPSLSAGAANVGGVDIFGHAGGTLDTVAGTSAGTLLTIQGAAGGVAVPVTGTLSASIGAFAPTPGYATLPVGPTTSNVALPTGADVLVYNKGSFPANVALGIGAGTTATTTNDLIQPNSWQEYAVGSNTYLAAIETAGATNLLISGGAGIAAGSIGPATTQPVSLATLPALTTGAATIGALVANQSVNTAQVNGVTTLTGTGAVGTGAQRVAVGTDTATIAGSAPGTAGTPSANVVTVQGPTSGGTALPVSGTFYQTTQPVSIA